MSAFCVYGMTDAIAKLSASKKLPPLFWEGSTEEFYEEYQERIYKAGPHRQVSPAYDAPQFCRDWIELAKKTMKTRGLRIMCHGQKTDRHGSPRIDRKTKQPVTGWIPYEQEPENGFMGIIDRPSPSCSQKKQKLRRVF